MGDGCVVPLDQEIRLVGDRQPRVDGPVNTGVLGRAGDEVAGQEGPSHRLRDPGLEIDGHRESAGELSKDQLLAGFSSDRLLQKLSRWPRVQVTWEASQKGSGS